MYMYKPVDFTTPTDLHYKKIANMAQGATTITRAHQDRKLPQALLKYISIVIERDK